MSQRSPKPRALGDSQREALGGGGVGGGVRSPGTPWVWREAAKLGVKGEPRGERCEEAEGWEAGEAVVPGRKGCDPCSRQEGEQPPREGVPGSLGPHTITPRGVIWLCSFFSPKVMGF